ncbi:hypothetical protein [Acinetobacter sp.]
MAQHYAAMLKQADLAPIQSIIHRIDHVGYPEKQLLTHLKIWVSAGFG